uniref:Uncharacterized protein n=1 Tax=Anguilla anguilla TaxID=7936 RepID=A0A0E9PC77_ANGAN
MNMERKSEEEWSRWCSSPKMEFCVMRSGCHITVYISGENKPV